MDTGFCLTQGPKHRQAALKHRRGQIGLFEDGDNLGPMAAGRLWGHIHQYLGRR